MEEDSVIERLKAKYATMGSLFPQSDYLAIEPDKPVIFFVLCGEYSAKGVWVHPCGVHFINKRQIPCSEQEKEPAACFICEKIRELRAKGVAEKDLFRYCAPIKYAMNVLVRGEQSPRVFLAPATVGEPIIRTWESGIKENINFFNPLLSVVFTVSRTAEAGKTSCTVDFGVEPIPIIAGDNIEERIAKILKGGANLDERFRLPTREEQETAWRNR
jgi:hypothetical protein